MSEDNNSENGDKHHFRAIPFLGASVKGTENRDSSPTRAEKRKKDKEDHQVPWKQKNTDDIGNSAAAPSRRTTNHGKSKKDPQPEFGHHESAAEFAKKREEDIVKDYNAPITWWMAATLFPLIAGTFGPMASAFNIMAIAIDWRTYVDPSSQEAEGQRIPDERWLLATNGVSLAIAIIANLVLLAQMGNRLRFNIASPITIIGWFISGIVDVVLVAIVPTQEPLPTDRPAAYSQAYYYAAFAGVLYILLSIMLTMTAWAIRVGHYSTEFKLTFAQRSLMLQTMLFLGYVLAAGAVYSHIEGWIYLDACYFIVVTLFTIGFGDFSPETHLGRALFFPMSVGGIIFVGLIVANIRSLVLESASVKVSTRLVEKARIQALKRGKPADGIIKIRGVVTRDINADSEWERRRNEFEAMREIQTVASHNDRMFALGLSLLAFCILWFIGAVVFWQAEKGIGGQDWSYFDSLYFTYVAQLTIGFGDYAPNTNGGKPAFVFWALIALPTLTVLIGAIGDATSDAVNWFFIFIGRHHDDIPRWFRGMHHDPEKGAKEIVALAKATSADDSEDGSGESRESEEVNGHAFRDIAVVRNGKVCVPEVQGVHIDPNQSHDDEKHDVLHALSHSLAILRTAQRVLTHLEEDRPKQYTFDEWAWALRLLGEDEGDSTGHRKLGTAPVPPATPDAPLPFCEHKHHMWSWMGQESPLMNLRQGSEPKWILKRLLQSLEADMVERTKMHRAEWDTTRAQSQDSETSAKTESEEAADDDKEEAGQ